MLTFLSHGLGIPIFPFCVDHDVLSFSGKGILMWLCPRGRRATFTYRRFASAFKSGGRRNGSVSTKLLFGHLTLPVQPLIHGLQLCRHEVDSAGESTYLRFSVYGLR